MKKASSILNVALVLAFFYCPQICQASKMQTNEMQTGMAFFNKKDYKNALPHFVQALKNNPRDYNALYFEAVTLHQLKKLESAKVVYRKVLNDFPDTPAAKNAHAALMYIDPNYARSYQLKMANTNLPSANRVNSNIRLPVQMARPRDFDDGSVGELTNCPDQARIPYEREGRNLIVQTYVNGRPVQMFFDSGAEGVVIRKSELESLGIKAPVGRIFSMSHGVGDGGAQRTWLARVDLKVGPIERKNFPLHVQEDPPTGGVGHPLLGQSFFRDFAYSLDPAQDGTRGTIFFQKKIASRAFAANDSSVIPFTNLGKDMLVKVEINGRKIPMIFDTGAETCVFTRQQYQSLGLSVPDDAQRGMDQGIAGVTASSRFTVDRMQLGPIIKNDVNVSVIDNSAIPYPLLGNSFIQDLRMDIDNDSHQLRLRR
jgi:clan AA aspartic protease (TIGR02281 family)